MEPTDQELQKCPNLYLTSDDPLDPQELYDQDNSPNHFRGDPMHHESVTNLGK